jgi:hypothetical protein
VGARLAEVTQAEPRGAVLLLQLVTLLLRQPRAAKAAVGAAAGEPDRPCNREVRADAGERFQHFRLRLVQAGREGGDADDEADSDSEAEGGEHRSSSATTKLAEHVADVEHQTEGTSPE